MPKEAGRYYEETGGPFFRLHSRKKFARLLYKGQTKLEALAREHDPYTHFPKLKANGESRQISAPRDDLKKVQARIAALLQRITPPDFLFAPVAKRSYVDNAARHLGAESVHLLDVLDFFPSCTGKKVYWLFHTRMQCSADVAGVITGLVTHGGSLPQGSPCSPILAYLSYVDMWENIGQIAKDAGCTLSVYADDLTVSGKTVPGSAIWEMKQLLRKHGHQHNTAKERCRHRRPAEITGVILRPDGLHPPNRSRKRLREARLQLKEVHSGDGRAAIESQIRGREVQMKQVEAGNMKH